MHCSRVLVIVSTSCLVFACGDGTTISDGSTADTGTSDGGAGDGSIDSTVPVDSGPVGDADASEDAPPVDASEDAPPVDANEDAPPADAGVSCSDEMRSASPVGGGTGTVDDPYVICTSDHLAYVATESAAQYEVWEDLDASGLPSDFYIPRFDGTLDGLGHVISSYRLVTRSLFNLGLIGELGEGAVVRGLSLENVEIEADFGNNVGALVGSSAGTIIDCHVLSGTVSGGDTIGGLVGQIPGTAPEEIRDSSSAATVTGRPSADAVGGIIGRSSADPLRLENVHFSGEVSVDLSRAVGGIGGELGRTEMVGASSTGRLLAFDEVGGLIGRLARGSIERSSATGEIVGHRLTGGLVGSVQYGVSVSDSYSRADIRDQGAARFERPYTHGGLIGDVNDSSLIERSYFAGSITVTTTADYWGGGLVGDANSIRIVDSFNAGTISVTARTANVSTMYTLESLGTVSNAYYDAFRTGLDRCWVNQVTPSPDCTAVNVGNAVPDYFFDSSSPPLDGWDFSPSGVWSSDGAGWPELR